MVGALHVERVEIGEAVAVQIGDARIAAPAGAAEAALRGDVLEAVAAEVPVEDRGLGAVGVQVPEKASDRPTNAPSGPCVVVGVLADVAEIQIEQAVVVVVEEHRAR